MITHDREAGTIQDLEGDLNGHKEGGVCYEGCCATVL